METISAWMNWEGGFDLVAATAPGLAQPNVIVHVARMVHTPVGSAPAGMILFAPDGMPPAAMGFVSPDERVGAYFGPNIFTGTPFENAPIVRAEIAVTNGDNWCEAKVTFKDFIFEARLEQLGRLQRFDRPAQALPFRQDVLEAVADKASLKINGRTVALHLPPVGISGGAPAVWSATGIYSR